MPEKDKRRLKRDNYAAKSHLRPPAPVYFHYYILAIALYLINRASSINLSILS